MCSNVQVAEKKRKAKAKTTKKKGKHEKKEKRKKKKGKKKLAKKRRQKAKKQKSKKEDGKKKRVTTINMGKKRGMAKKKSDDMYTYGPGQLFLHQEKQNRARKRKGRLRCCRKNRRIFTLRSSGN